MDNIFEGLINLGKWKVEKSEKFDEKTLALIESNTVVETQYGKAVQFTLKSGAKHNIWLSVNSQQVPVGQAVDLTQATYLTLSKPGSGIIHRIEI